GITGWSTPVIPRVVGAVDTVGAERARLDFVIVVGGLGRGVQALAGLWWVVFQVDAIAEFALAEIGGDGPASFCAGVDPDRGARGGKRVLACAGVEPFNLEGQAKAQGGGVVVGGARVQRWVYVGRDRAAGAEHGV